MYFQNPSEIRGLSFLSGKKKAAERQCRQLPFVL
jgi:hypothetical protein